MVRSRRSENSKRLDSARLQVIRGTYGGKMLMTSILALLNLLLLVCCRADPPSDSELASAFGFVAGFYDWYVPGAKQGTGWQLVIQDSAHLFATGLIDDLRADAEAQASSPDAIVGLDGDPFLDAQDFCEEYEVGGARHQGNSVVVEVRGDCSGEPHGAPDVVAELSRSGSGWVFVNFLYPQYNSDLVEILRRLRRLREAEDPGSR